MVASLAPDVVSTLQEGRQAYIAVDAQDGPHVTPELYAWSGGALWFAVASTTLKAKVLARRSSSGVLVSAQGRSIVLGGHIEVVDPRDLRRLPHMVRRLPETLPAVARYTVRNAPDLVAFVGDLVTGKLGWRLPPARVLLRFEPARLVVLEGDTLVAHGAWPAATTDFDSTLPAGGQPAVAAMPGPFAVPGRWFEDEQRLHLAAGLRGLVDGSDWFPMSVVLDDYAAPGPAAKQGTLRRGRGRLPAGSHYVECELDKAVTWDGIETTTTATVA